MSDGAPIHELGRFAEVLRDDIVPLLEEYCYEDFDALERILGNKLVNKATRRIAHHLLLVALGPVRHASARRSDFTRAPIATMMSR